MANIAEMFFVLRRVKARLAVLMFAFKTIEIPLISLVSCLDFVEAVKK